MAHRKLTTGEITLAKEWFGDTIDYTRVRLYDTRVLPKKIQAENRAMAFFNKISFPGAAYAPDFSMEKDAFKKSVFIHELVHIWQLQNNIVHPVKAYLKEIVKTSFNKNASYQDCYLYTLTKDKKITDYGFEQQAAIIQDYFLLSSENNATSYKSRRQNNVTDTNTLKSLYQGVLNGIIPPPKPPQQTPKPV